MARTSTVQKKRKPAAKTRGGVRGAREKRAVYRTPRWKIPNITPIGSDAPVSKTLPLAVKRIAENLQPEKIILFGSYAYGKPTPDSDVDLLVIMQTGATSADRSWSVSSLLIPRLFPVDILVRTPQEIDSEQGLENSFVQRVVTQGRVLYERREQPSRVG